MMFAERRARKKFEKAIARLPAYEQHLRRLRRLAATGGSRKQMLAEARAAFATAPDGESAQHIRRWLEPLEAGRTIRTKVVPGKIISVMGAPVELVHQVEEAFKGVDES